MSKCIKVLVVTNPEAGWDCVVGVYSSEARLLEGMQAEEGQTAREYVDSVDYYLFEMEMEV